MEYETKYSGKKEEFVTGAIRDTREGKGRYDLISPFALLRLAKVYERGALQKGERNWEKGFSCSRGIDSALRHIQQFLAGMRDEDHLAQSAWNLFAVIHFLDQIEKGKLPPELNDLPSYQP